MTAPMPETMSPREKVAELIYDRLGIGSENESVEQVSGEILAALAPSGDHAELARLAEAAKEEVILNARRPAHAPYQDRALNQLWGALSPNRVLALIAEVAALRASASVLEPELGDLEATNADLSALLTEAAACIREMVEWRPIETAPRDGTVIHVYAPGFDWPEAVLWEFYDPDDAEETGEDGYWTYAETLMADATDSCEPELWTHWRPITLPPAPGAEDE